MLKIGLIRYEVQNIESCAIEYKLKAYFKTLTIFYKNVNYKVTLHYVVNVFNGSYNSIVQKNVKIYCVNEKIIRHYLFSFKQQFNTLFFFSL